MPTGRTISTLLFALTLPACFDFSTVDNSDTPDPVAAFGDAFPVAPDLMGGGDAMPIRNDDMKSPPPPPDLTSRPPDLTSAPPPDLTSAPPPDLTSRPPDLTSAPPPDLATPPDLAMQCANASNGTPCGPSTCAAGVMIAPRCMSGQCKVTTIACTNNLGCNGTACHTSCAVGSSASCLDGTYYCAPGGASCRKKKPSGADCAEDYECQSGKCPSGKDECK